MSDSCGYIALSHPPSPPRIIIAFRGTYSITNTIVDLSTIPQEYVPYPDEGGPDISTTLQSQSRLMNLLNARRFAFRPLSDPSKCDNCMVHAGFYQSWINT